MTERGQSRSSNQNHRPADDFQSINPVTPESPLVQHTFKTASTAGERFATQLWTHIEKDAWRKVASTLRELQDSDIPVEAKARVLNATNPTSGLSIVQELLHRSAPLCTMQPPGQCPALRRSSCHPGGG